MSYANMVKPGTIARRPRSRYHAVGDDVADCVAQGVAAVRPMLEKVVALKVNWNPTTGLYAPADLLRASQAAFDALAVARANVTSALNGYNRDVAFPIIDAIGAAQLDIQRFINTAQTSDANTLIKAPDFKGALVDALEAAANATAKAIALTCAQPMWVDAVVAIASAFTTVADIAVGIGSAIYEAGKTIVSVPGRIADTVDTLLKIGVVGGTAYLLYTHFGKGKRRKRTGRR